MDLVVVVDNASSDDTQRMIAAEFPRALLVALEVNRGGAGGFYEGIRAGLAARADWLWLLDDDTFAHPDALEALLRARDGLASEPALLASRVEWRDGQPHPTNCPTVRRRSAQELVAAARKGLLPLRASTFVSLLLSRWAVERAGMPRRDFFYQADDIEYTARILRRFSGYYVPGSVVEHRTPSKQTSTGDERRLHYHVRNTVLMLRGRAWAPREKPALAWALVRVTVQYLRANRFAPASARTLLRGLGAGLSARPAPGRRAGGPRRESRRPAAARPR